VVAGVALVVGEGETRVYVVVIVDEVGMMTMGQ
jgi:hypothetical protein